MKSYINHLLSDIRQAHRTEKPSDKPESESLEEHFKDVDRWISGDAEHTLGYYCGLKAEAFPPYDQLTEELAGSVLEALTSMLETWNVSVDLPDNLPPPRSYELMVGLLNQEFMPFSSGMFVFDFCTGYAPECELKEFCKCLEVWEDAGSH